MEAWSETLLHETRDRSRKGRGEWGKGGRPTPPKSHNVDVFITTLMQKRRRRRRRVELKPQKAFTRSSDSPQWKEKVSFFHFLIPRSGNEPLPVYKIGSFFSLHSSCRRTLDDKARDNWTRLGVSEGGKKSLFH